MTEATEITIDGKAERRLKQLLDRKDRKLTAAARTLNAELNRLVVEPDRIVIRRVGFDALRQMRVRLRATRQAIAAVDTRTPARKNLLGAFDALDASLAELQLALGVRLSRESIAGIRRAAKRVDQTGRTIRRIRTGLR